MASPRRQTDRELRWTVSSRRTAVLGMRNLAGSTGARARTVRAQQAPAEGGQGCFPSSWHLTSSLCWCLGTPWLSLSPLYPVSLCAAELHWPRSYPGPSDSRETVLSESARSPLRARLLLKPRGPGTAKCYGPRDGGQRPRSILRRSRGSQKPPAAHGAPSADRADCCYYFCQRAL